MGSFSKLLSRSIRSPYTVIRGINADTVRIAWNFLKSGDVSGLCSGIDYFLGRTATHTDFHPETTFGMVSEDSPIVLPACAAPVVSIIIPVHNQWPHTHSCLASISKNSGEVPYEVIIADDASTDETIRVTEIVTNVRVVRTENNVGFLGNCNNASNLARGKYFLFLNNDTNVQQDWLAPLVSLAESDERVGIVGSKLVYPDGMLQEAGGIIWNDASGWNFGWRDDPSKPEYSYVKDVDYISGASIMVRKDLWLKAGGFDDLFAPAYFEDTDLAFRARALGYRVVFQPRSVVVHFEGVSHGRDTSKGIKSYQQVNKEKFLARWHDVLQSEHFPNGTNVFQARDRSRKKKALLVIDHYVPMYDRDAGSFFMYSLLQALVALDYKVVFWPENLYAHQPYTDVLQQLGVEVVVGPHSFEEYLNEFGKHFDAAILTRNHIAINFIDAVRRHIPKVIYHDPDLEFLREQRRFEQEGVNSPAELQKIKEREFYLFRNCDIVGIHSPVERDMIMREMPKSSVEVIPLPVSDVLPSDSPFSDRRGLLFVGGTHPPNVDALRYFIKDVLPALTAVIPGITLTVAGEVSRHALSDLDLSNVVFTGYVADLRPLFQQALIYVAPLRFGAGIKGKILEAMNYGLPVVTSSIGAEGIGVVSGVTVVIGDSAEVFAEAVIRLHHDQRFWEEIRHNARQYVVHNFSQGALQSKVDSVMKTLFR